MISDLYGLVNISVSIPRFGNHVVINPCIYIMAGVNLHTLSLQHNGHANLPTAALQSNGSANLHNGYFSIERPVLDPNGRLSIQRSFYIWYLVMCTTVMLTHG